MSLAAPSTAAACVAEIRQRVYEVEAQGRQDEARALLAHALRQLGRPDPELLADLAAMALRDGDLVPAIRGARLALDARPEDAVADGEALSAALDSAQFTLGLALAAIGSTMEAAQRLQALMDGARGERFRARTPELAALVQAELDRLQSACGDALPAPSPRQEPTSVDDDVEILRGLVRTMRLGRVLHAGAASSTLAGELLAAMSGQDTAAAYTLAAGGCGPLETASPAHHALAGDPRRLLAADLHGVPLDLVCLDAGDAESQLDLVVRLHQQGLVTDDTVIAVRRTGLLPRRAEGWQDPVVGSDGRAGYVHQDRARHLVNRLRERLGYDALCLQADVRRLEAQAFADTPQDAPVPQGLTLLRRFRTLSA